MRRASVSNCPTKVLTNSKVVLLYNMKNKVFRLTLFVTIDPQGESDKDIERRLAQVVRDAVNNGTLTGDSPSTVENWSCEIKKF